MSSSPKIIPVILTGHICNALVFRLKYLPKSFWRLMYWDIGNAKARPHPSIPYTIQGRCTTINSISKLADLIKYIVEYFIKTYGDLIYRLIFQRLPFDVINFKFQSYFPFLPPQATGQRRCPNPRPLGQTWVQVVQRLCVWRRGVGIRSSNFLHVFLKLFFR